MSVSHVGPVRPVGQRHMKVPFTGDVSHVALDLHGLLRHASSRWHHKPASKEEFKIDCV